MATSVRLSEGKLLTDEGVWVPATALDGAVTLTIEDAVVLDDLTVTDLSTLTGGLLVGAGEGLTKISGVHYGAFSVVVPDIADAEIDEVAVDVSSLTYAPAAGDFVLAAPLAALPTSCVFCGAYVSGADEVTVSFAAKEGGAGVTGAAVSFGFLFIVPVTS